MKLDFDINSVALTEFGVALDDGKKRSFVNIAVDASVQDALREMVSNTLTSLSKHIPTRYNPSEKHGNLEYLYLPLNNEMTTELMKLHEAAQLDINCAALKNSSEVIFYFVRLRDTQDRHLTALRRASQFKGVLKKKLLYFLDDSLKIVEDKVFKLDSDFDLLIDSANVHILRPSGFESIGKLQKAILDAVPKNIKAIRADLSFVELDGIEEYASKHPRAARYLASIHSHVETRNISKASLKKLCKKTGVEVKESRGKLIIQEGHELGFLEVLDRRRYEVELVKGRPERFRAVSRKAL